MATVSDPIRIRKSARLAKTTIVPKEGAQLLKKIAEAGNPKERTKLVPKLISSSPNDEPSRQDTRKRKRKSMSSDADKETSQLHGGITQPKTSKRKKTKSPEASEGGKGNETEADPVTDNADNEVNSQSEQKQFWLFKSEPETRLTNGVDVRFSINDLKECTEPEPWSGVRNYLARNNMMAMKKGDLAFFYHSNTKIPGIVGICEVVDEADVDVTAFDPKDPYYDSKSDRASPRWFCVKVNFHTQFDAVIPLATLQAEAKRPGSALGEMQVATMRRAASVSAVTKSEWEWILNEMR